MVTRKQFHSFLEKTPVTPRTNTSRFSRCLRSSAPPAARSGGFDTHTNRLRQTAVEGVGLAVLVLQTLLGQLPCAATAWWDATSTIDSTPSAAAPDADWARDRANKWDAGRNWTTVLRVGNGVAIPATATAASITAEARHWRMLNWA